MPVDRLYHAPDSLWGFWKITEDEPTLASKVPTENPPPEILNPSKRLEFLAGRALIRELLHEWKLPYDGLTKDSYGKPFLNGSSIHLSISHSYPYVATILHRSKNVGIDLEQPKEKLLKIAPRVLHPGELSNAGNDVVKHCIYWCAKEALVKIYGKRDLVFAENLLVDPFKLQNKGYLVGRIIANDTETAIPLEYIVYENFVVAVSRN
jgi:4'-phosphopantetheinyl transferase EntD